MALVPPFLGPGFRLGARWNRLGEAVKTRKNREKTGGKWARYGLKRVNREGTGGITWGAPRLVQLVARVALAQRHVHPLSVPRSREVRQDGGEK